MSIAATALAMGAAAPVASAQDAPTVLRLEEKLSYGELLVIGEAEAIKLPEFDVVWPGRIDTGATSTSIFATDVEEFDRDGALWVRFTLRNDDSGDAIEVERPVERIAEIRRRGEGENHRRHVVLMDLGIGEVASRIEVNLADRTGFEFPVLIGRNFLNDRALVDVSRAYVQGDVPAGEK